MKPLFARNFVILVVIAHLLTNCTLLGPNISRNLDNSFREMVSIDDMNTSLRAKVLDVKRDKYGVNIHLLIENLGEAPIYLSADKKTLFVKIFGVQNNEWVEVPDEGSYFSITGGDGYTLMPDKNDQPNFFTTIVNPDETKLENQGKQEIFRILFVGEFMAGDQKTGVSVGAYTDVVVDR